MADNQGMQGGTGNVEGRENNFMDVDRMVNEGLGGGTVSTQNGYIGDSTTDTMAEPDSVQDRIALENEPEQ